MDTLELVEADSLSYTPLLQPWYEKTLAHALFGEWFPTRIVLGGQRYPRSAKRRISAIVWTSKGAFLAGHAPSLTLGYREVPVKIIPYTMLPESPWGDVRSYLAKPEPLSVDRLSLMALSFKPFELSAFYSYIAASSKTFLKGGLSCGRTKQENLRRDASVYMAGSLYPSLEIAERFLTIRGALYEAVSRQCLPLKEVTL